MEVDPGNEGSVELDKTALLEGLVTLSTTSSLVQETIRIFMEHIGSFLKGNCFHSFGDKGGLRSCLCTQSSAFVFLFLFSGK